MPGWERKWDSPLGKAGSITIISLKNSIHSRKLTWNPEPRNEGLEDDFRFQTGDIQVPCYFSGGVTSVAVPTETSYSG